MVERLIYESKKSKIFYRDESEWNHPIVVKVLNYEFPTPSDISQFYNEFEIISNTPLPGIRNALLKTKEQNRHAMILEWVEGENLLTAFKNKQNDIVDFLYISVAIAQSLSEIHQHNIIHKDIAPFNILVNLQQRSVKIIDFGISTKLDLKQHYVGNPERLEGTLAYNSPEQTGRVNRVVDYRTDLYSLGITFYEMLTGALPFTAKDAMGLVHAHIAVVPKPVSEVNKKVPVQLSRIIQKLIAKNAEDRYQSAHGLKVDLERCLESYQIAEKIPEFELGQSDFSGKFHLPQKLYGRDQELNTLLESFDAAASGALRMTLVTGNSGTGKSALVYEVHKPITAKRCYFISGKFDQFQREVPYYAILEAFKDLVNTMLAESEAKLNALRGSILEALGEEGKVLTDVLPNLELVTGPQPDVPQIGGNETQARFNYVFQKFVNACCNKEHPLVLFIDDLQWADSASLNLLEVLMSDRHSGYFLCIGAYRDNEVNATHPFMTTVANIRKVAPDRISTIHIGNLTNEHVNQLIADAVLATPGQTRELTDLVYGKTQGNAFFTTQFLKSIAGEKLLEFDFGKLAWQWNIQKIREKNITDNVVELMTGKILRLPEPTQEAMKAGACTGNSFDLDILAVILQKDAGVLKEDLYEGLKEGLIAPLGESKIRFTHDRIQQAVYALIPPDQKNEVHLRIGTLLNEHISPEKRSERLFDIVNHLNTGSALITGESEREALANLNFQAGKKAKQNSAFTPALAYFEAGIKLLRADCWQSQYDLSLQLHTEACEAAYLCADFEKTEYLYKTVIDNAKNILEKVKPYEIRILAYKAENKLLEAIRTGLEVLRQLGEDFPDKPNLAHVGKDLTLTMLRLRGKSNDYLMNLPVMTDPIKIAAMRIIADITSSVYWAMPALLPLIVFRMVKMSLRYGNNAVSCFAYGSYGVILCGVLGMMKRGNDFGQLALGLLDKLNAKEWKAQIYVSPYGLTIHWRQHVKNTLRPLQESFHIGLETGLIEFACVNTNLYCIHSFLCGRQLERLEEETRAYSQSYALFKQETNVNYNEVYRQAILNFMGKSKNPLVLSGDAFDEEKMHPQMLERNDKTGTFFIHFLKLMLGYHFRDLQSARYHAREARKLLEAVLAKFEIPNHHLYEALTALALYPDASRQEKKKLAAIARKAQATLKKWAKDAPQNFQHKYDLIEAERLRVLNRPNDARLLYDKAIQGAADNEFTQEEALAYELAGRFYLERQSNNLAEYYLKAAYNMYREWGATAKLRNLEQNFPKYVRAINHADGDIGRSGMVDSKSSMVDASVLDITTVLKASTMISGEVVISRLLEVLMEIVIENAGAQRGVLLLEKNNELYIEAQSDANAEIVRLLEHIPLTGSNLIAENIVKYVQRSREYVVVHEALRDMRYQTDPYIVQHKLLSVMCIPIVNQGKFIGILYLENNLTTGAFTQERVNLLSLLSGQIAVSIDNAILYDQLEQKVQERTFELAREKQKSDDLLYNILPVETALELKEKGFAEARHFDKVSVLFTDIKGFTSISQALSPAELVAELNECFKAFDEIMEKYGIEKIKTIGDSYMAAGGLPVPNSTHAVNIVKAALEIRNFIAGRRKQRGNLGFEMRIGVHTGPVVAGIVGTKKFQYDIWGDTVNLASRMESSGTPGKVNISQATFDLVKDHFHCEYRGELDAKGKGLVKMYFAEKINH
jgi:predicted ATPase/class 3 adenylate cyclase